MTISTATVKGAGRVAWRLLQALLGGFSVLALFANNAQLALVPYLVPVQWVVAQRSKLFGRLTFTILAAALVTQYAAVRLHVLSRMGPAGRFPAAALGALAGWALYRAAAADWNGFPVGRHSRRRVSP